MTTPIWSLLGFALWTLVLLVTTIGVYRWSNILTGRRAMTSFRADQVTGADWYRRAMRAHANCVENLPVFGAIVFALDRAGLQGSMIDIAAMVVLPARLVQSCVHVLFTERPLTISIRFGFFSVQLAAFGVLAWPLVQLFWAGS